MKEVLTPRSKVTNEISLGFNTNRSSSLGLIESMAYEIEHADVMGKNDKCDFNDGLKNIAKHGSFHYQAFYIYITTNAREPEKYVKRLLKILAKKYKNEHISCRLRYVVNERVYDKDLKECGDLDQTYVEFEFDIKDGKVKQNYAYHEPYSVYEEYVDRPLETYNNPDW